MWKRNLALSVAVVCWASQEGQAFFSPCATKSSCSRATSSSLSMADDKSIVVISPPGGVGEVAAVKAATMGSSVKWFVVSSAGSQSVKLSQDALQEMEAAGGQVELAGADAKSLLLPEEDIQSAIGAVSQWCGVADGMVCTMDGVDGVKTADDKQDPEALWKDAIKVAAQQASKSVKGVKLAILAADEDESDEEEGGGLFSNLLGKSTADIPTSLSAALGGSKITKLRHGSLFGTPESSPAFSGLVGGPRKDPVLCEEYTMRSVRIDPSLSVSGNAMMGSATRSSRHAVGEAAALMVTGKVPVERDNLDVCLSSLRGSDAVSQETWEEEFKRLEKMLSSGQGAQLFSTNFAAVPDVERLADWLATKWAPAVMRTYDIAAIRTGARPVYASRPADGKVEIVWQELVDFESVVAGKMIIQVTDTGLVATRGPGDATKGFREISRKPLPGEDVLLRSLADAASQAIEKGLAKKLAVPKAKKAPVKKAEPAAPVSSLQSAVTVEAPPKPAAATTTTSDSGPRQAGARRSSERARGTRRRKDAAAPAAEPPKSDDGAFQ